MKATAVAITFLSLWLKTIFCDNFDKTLLKSSICENSDSVRDVAFVRIGRYRKELKDIYFNQGFGTHQLIFDHFDEFWTLITIRHQKIFFI